MKIFFILSLLLGAGSALASDDILEQKKGFVFGLGFAASRFSYPAEYSGADDDKIDLKASLLGGVAQLGYDVLLGKRFLLGIRGEGMLLDNLGTGNEEDNRLNARTRAAHGLLRIGGVFPILASDPVGSPARMTLEVFLEGGPTSGTRAASKRFSSGTDRFQENLREEYQGQILGGGLNLTSVGGAFFELKAQQTRVGTSVRRFSGSKVEGGVPMDLNRKDDTAKDFATFFIVLGQRF